MAKNFGRVNVSVTASTGGLTAGLSRASKQLAGFRSGVGGVANVMGMLGGSMGTLLPLFGAFTTAAGAISALTSATRAAEALHNLSQELGVAPGNLQVLTQVAGEFGVSQEQMTGALRRSTRMVSQLAAGTPSAVKAFQLLGLTMEDLAGLDSAEQFRLIAERIAALPPEMQAAAAINIFGRSGQGLLNFIRQGGAAIGEMDTLLTQLGVKMSREQVAAIEAMGDAIGRLALPMQGFVNQFLAELAPAITAVSTLIVDFFAKNTAGWTVAKSLADGLVQSIRFVVAAMSVLTGIFQVFQALGSQIGQMFSEVFSVILAGVGNVMESMASLAEAAGFTDLSNSLQQGAAGASQMQQGAAQMGQIYGQAAADSFAAGMQNITNPFASFDAAFAQAQADAQEVGARRAAAAAGETIGSAIRASSQALSAIVIGTAEGEAFRNSIMRGADPRLEGDKEAQRTADATEETAEGVNELASIMRNGGLAQAAIMV